MIFDCHTHLGDPSHIGGEFLAESKAAWGEDYQMRCSPEEHAQAVKQCDGAIVLAMRSEERRVGKEGRSRWSPYH